MKITAALENGSGVFVMRELDLEKPRGDEVLVKIAACGVCHTDIAMRSGNYLLGHEVSGIVVKTGKKVSGFEAGDKVILSYTYCGQCPACRDGRTYECAHIYKFFEGLRLDGTTPLSLKGKPVGPLLRQGGFSTHCVCHVNALTKVATEAELKLLGPLGCAVITGAGSVLNYLKPEKNRPLAVFGVGAVGLSAVLAAKIVGSDPVIAVDRLPVRLDMARQFGATYCVNGDEVDDVATAIREISGGIDYGFDTSGNSSLLDSFRAALNPNGQACGVGIGGSIHFSEAEREQGKSWQTPNEGWSIPQKFIPYLLSFHSDGQFPFDKMISCYSFDSINEAFADVEAGKTIKPVLVMDEAVIA